MKKGNTKRSTSSVTPTMRNRASYMKNFEIELPAQLSNDLSYFVRQELEYFNALIKGLTPRLRAYPAELSAMKDNERKLWNECAERAVNPRNLIEYPLEQWPQHLHYLHQLVYDSTGQKRISPAHISIIEIAAAPARIHATVRRAMASEVLRHLIGQCNAFIQALKMESLHAPIQVIQEQSVDTKRHLQIPYSLVKISYNEEEHTSYVQIPYSKMPISVPHYNLTSQMFRLLILRAPHLYSENQNRWQLDFRDDASAGYLLGITDYVERRKRR